MANVSKFERENIVEGRGGRRMHGNVGSTYKNMQWAKSQENLNWNNVNQETVIGGYGSGNVGNGRSYLDAVKGIRRQEQRVSVVLPEGCMNDMGDWNKRTFLLKAKTLENLCKAKVILRDICSHSMEVRYAGGMNILVTTGSQMVAEEIMIDYKQKFEEFFTQVTLWKEDMNRCERLAWIRVFGVPISLRNKETLNIIGCHLGEVVRELEANMEDNNLTCAHLGVIVNTGKVFNDEVLVQYKNVTFKCWVSEVSGNWAPKFVEDESPFINIPVITNEETGEKEDEMQENDQNSNSVPDGGNGEIPVEKEIGSEKTKGQENEESHREERSDSPALNFGGNWQEVFAEHMGNGERQDDIYPRNPSLMNLNDSNSGTNTVFNFNSNKVGTGAHIGPDIEQNYCSRPSGNIIGEEVNGSGPENDDPLELNEIIWGKRNRATKRKKGDFSFTFTRQNRVANKRIRTEDGATEVGEALHEEILDSIEHGFDLNKDPSDAVNTETEATIELGKMVGIRVSKHHRQIRKIVTEELERIVDQ
ncbi:hypothetical protein Hanom_Chr03g00236581 [Helianthus anomalus]